MPTHSEGFNSNKMGRGFSIIELSIQIINYKLPECYFHQQYDFPFRILFLYQQIFSNFAHLWVSKVRTIILYYKHGNSQTDIKAS
jgi:hypothetical protein